MCRKEVCLRIFETFSSSAASKPSVDSGSKGLPSEKEQTQVMSEIISQLQMIKTRLLMTYSHAGGRNIDRELRKLIFRQKMLKTTVAANISHLVSKYLHELDELMYSVVAKDGEMWNSTRKHNLRRYIRAQALTDCGHSNHYKVRIRRKNFDLLYPELSINVAVGP